MMKKIETTLLIVSLVFLIPAFILELAVSFNKFSHKHDWEPIYATEYIPVTENIYAKTGSVDGIPAGLYETVNTGQYTTEQIITGYECSECGEVMEIEGN